MSVNIAVGDLVLPVRYDGQGVGVVREVKYVYEFWKQASRPVIVVERQTKTPAGIVTDKWQQQFEPDNLVKLDEAGKLLYV